MANASFQKLIATAGWACLAFIVFVTLSSIQARPVIAGGLFTAVERFAAYAVFGLLLYLAYPRHLAFVCVMVFGSAATLEWLQNFSPDRHARLLDAIEKLLGGAAGLLTAAVLRSGFWRKATTTANDQPRRN